MEGLLADYGSGDDSNPVSPAPASALVGTGSGILVNAAPAVEVLAPQTKVLPSDMRMVEHNPTYEQMYTEPEVPVAKR